MMQKVGAPPTYLVVCDPALVQLNAQGRDGHGCAHAHHTHHIPPVLLRVDAGDGRLLQGAATQR